MSTSFKVYFNNEIRRVGIPSACPTFAQIQDAIRTIFATTQDSIKIQYKDEDNDAITVGSQLEWDEALIALNDSAVKKLYISITKAPVERKAACVATRRMIVQPRRCGLASEVERMIEDISNGIKVDYSKLGNNLTRLPHVLQRRSIMYLNTKEYSKALNILNAAIEVTPHSNIDWYNLACVHALMGNSKEACESLRKSTEFGYKNVRHLESDSDLESIRGEEEYKEIVAGLKAGCPIRLLPKKDEEKKPQQQEDSIMIQAESSEPAEPVPIAEEKQNEEVEFEFKNEMEILKNMGFGDEELNRSLLVIEKGNIEAVANTLISM